MTLFKFTPTVENYLAMRGQEVRCGTSKCKVSVHRTSSRMGSYERGLKFGSSEYALLVRASDRLVSMDHGKTWYRSVKEAMRSKGKMRLKSTTTKEFAFDSIQAICRKWDGPGYRWHR